MHIQIKNKQHVIQKTNKQNYIKLFYFIQPTCFIIELPGNTGGDNLREVEQVVQGSSGGGVAEAEGKLVFEVVVQVQTQRVYQHLAVWRVLAPEQVLHSKFCINLICKFSVI